jgi:hypothetical protein
MSRAKASGYSLKAADAPIILGMIARGDRDHDIAAWFGVNQGRVADVKDRKKFSSASAAPTDQLPPSGPPGIKDKRLRASVSSVIKAWNDGKPEVAKEVLLLAAQAYDRNEA